ncbi:MarC family protein [Breoghania sp. L-A4]|uniref:MarC family protein n=1 Tax=Breoghania sp. L-A4 TaxID=2304600 RepID=UPI000E358AD2|nr:MarC family protein [Breoghania sp. L-A4]AXS40555.1 MarC family protein [Breoghania sp. L-A4]
MPVDYLINAFATLFVTIDPIGLAPMFLGVTAGMTTGERRKIAIRASIIAVIILMVFLVGGNHLLELLGISVPAFQISGGLLLLFIAAEMIFGWRQQRKSKAAEALAHDESDSGVHEHDVSVFPLAIPLIAGPASISAVILLASQAPDSVGYAGLIAVTLLIIGSCFVIFTAADRIEKLLGATVQLVLTRLLGVLLAALAVQFVGDGVRAFIAG